jgi:hypothetical protein
VRQALQGARWQFTVCQGAPFFARMHAGPMDAASDLMIRTKITTRTVWKRKKKKNSAARQILKD